MSPAFMLDLAFARARGRADVCRPAPTGLVGGSADRGASDMNDFKFAFGKRANFVGFIEALENDVNHDGPRQEMSSL